MESTDLNPYIDPEQLKLDQYIDITNLTDAAAKQQSLYTHYATIAVRCRSQYDRVKAQMGLIESLLDNEHRTALRVDNPKVTEAQIRAAVVSDRRYRAMVQKEIDAASLYRIAEKVEKGFEQRRDMLQLLARQQAREADGQLRVMVNQDARQRVMAAMRANAEALKGASI